MLLGGFASKVLVAPKVGFLPQKSFHILIAVVDYDLPAGISEFVLVLAAWFTLVGWVGRVRRVGFCLICDVCRRGEDLFFAVR